LSYQRTARASGPRRCSPSRYCSFARVGDGSVLVTATPRCRHQGATVFVGETVLVENPRHGLAVGSIGMEALWLG
jgi:hypothetical protein